MHNGMSAHSAKESHADLHDRIEQRFAAKYAEQVALYEKSHEAEITELKQTLAICQNQLKEAEEQIAHMDKAVVYNTIALLNSFGISGTEADAFVYGEKE